MDPGTREDIWTQNLTPDLSAGEHLGDWVKVAKDQKEFLRRPICSKGPPEVDYGETPGLVSTELLGQGVTRGFIVIVTEITVTAPNRKTKVFKPSQDNITESVIHEISAHAGEIELGRPSEHHQGDVETITDEITELFRNRDDASPLTTDLRVRPS